MKLDHLLWAAPDLDAGIAQFAELTGVMPAIGGSHPGFGTRNALASLGDTYIEVIAPDPAQDLGGTLGAAFAALDAPYLYSAAFSAGDLDAVGRDAHEAGLTAGEIVEMSRTRPDDGLILNWAVLKLSQAELGDRFPFVIDWKGSPHPSGTTPGGLSLIDLRVLAQDPDPLAKALTAMEMDLDVQRAERAGFTAKLFTPNGEISLR